VSELYREHVLHYGRRNTVDIYDFHNGGGTGLRKT